MTLNSVRYIFEPSSRARRNRRWRLPGAACSLLALLLTLTSATAGAGPRILQIHYADPAAVEAALERIYGDRLVVARVGAQLVLEAGRTAGDDTLETAVQMLADLDVPPRILRITLNRRTPGADLRSHDETRDVIRYHTGDSADSWHAQLESGATLVLQRSRLESTLERAGWGWAESSARPLDDDHLQLQVFAKGDTVRVIYDYRLRRGSRWQSAASTLIVPLGQWSQLLGNPVAGSEAAAAGPHAEPPQRYGTAADDIGRLWVLVEPVPR